MNSYKIFSTDGAGELTSYVTAIDEKDARRIFKQQDNGKDMKIVTVTLHKENVPATKQQEREALARIRAIVETLEPSSYVGTALEGCLEDADTNIENDFGDSMKRRWEHSETQLKAEKEAHAETVRELEIARRALLDAERNADFFRDKAIDSDDLTDIAQLIEEKTFALAGEVRDAADRIVEAAGEPESEAFQNAVKEHRAAKSKLEYYAALANRIEHAQGRQ